MTERLRTHENVAALRCLGERQETAETRALALTLHHQGISATLRVETPLAETLLRVETPLAR